MLLRYFSESDIRYSEKDAAIQIYLIKTSQTVKKKVLTQKHGIYLEITTGNPAGDPDITG